MDRLPPLLTNSITLRVFEHGGYGVLPDRGHMQRGPGFHQHLASLRNRADAPQKHGEARWVTTPVAPDKGIPVTRKVEKT